jgi:hypothetical protein
MIWRLSGWSSTLCSDERSLSAQRFYKLPDLDHFLRPAAVPEIAIRLAFWRAAACTVEATNGPAV